MELIGVIAMFAAIAVLAAGAKAVWWSGFTAGTLAEARFWLAGVDTLRAPNWQSLVIDGEGMTPEQTKWMNQLYVQTYSLALFNLKEELAAARTEAVEKAIAEEQKQIRRFEGR